MGNLKIKYFYAPVAQLDRVFGYEPKGRGFESLQARIFTINIFNLIKFLSGCKFSTCPLLQKWHLVTFSVGRVSKARIFTINIFNLIKFLSGCNRFAFILSHKSLKEAHRVLCESCCKFLLLKSRVLLT